MVLSPGFARTPPPVPQCPPGWNDGPPDFVGVGVQKAGTTWWYHLIAAHPGVVDTEHKELHFFEWHWDHAGDEYASLYAKYFCRPPGLKVGEWTPRYATDPWTCAMLARAAPEARLLLLLRDPIERFRSGVSMYRSRQQRLQPGTPVSIHPRVLVDAIERGRYAKQLERMLRWFPREQLLVLQYEQCIADTERELTRTYEFLGLDETGFVPENLRDPVFQTEAKIELPADFRDRLHDEFDDDVRRLATVWPDLDLGLWENFANLA